ncbi:MAG: 5-(carboxyamino)imidazole ribonucleotide synthase [Pseudomonadota bacterium]
MTATSDAAPVEPNGVIGILGGGQLGRMLAMSAAQLGLRTHIFCPDDACPAYDVCAEKTVADYDDVNALEAFANAADVVTYEFENVPARTVEILQNFGADVFPGSKALAVAQDRLAEKEFIREAGADTAAFYSVDDVASLNEGLKKIGRPAILKTRRFGYDGKGQTLISDQMNDLDLTWEAANKKAWEEIGARPAILEAFIDFTCEISIIGARSRSGEIALYDPAENTHRGGILRRSCVPAKVSAETIRTAQRIASDLLERLDYVGVIGVEFFVKADGSVIVNEFAPRVHNSGHWTQDACAVSQFEQHVRVVAGWPLGDTARHTNAVMENLIGDDVKDWRTCLQSRNLCVHLYGKRKALPGRKMGHVTEISPLS